MNKRQKEVMSATLEDEAKILNSLQKNYTTALADIKQNIKLLQSNPLTQSKAYQLDFQKQLEKQISGILDKLQGDNFTSIADYLNTCYAQGFLGTMYDIHGQGIPIMLPLNQQQVLKAVQKTGDDIKLSAKLGDSDSLKKQIISEMQRGFSTDMSYADMARNISNYGQVDFNRSMRIARTEGHRVQNEAKLDTYKNVKKKGADIVKQWDATLDGNTRPNHKKLDGQIRGLDENFEVDGISASCPGNFGDPSEDCNCRCALLQRARWALDEDELNTLQERAEYFGLDKSDSFAEFKEKYMNAVENSSQSDIIKADKSPVNIQLFAQIPKEKFTKYALDPERAPDKAYAFKNALGYTKENYQELIDNINDNLDEDLLKLKAEDKYGKRYELVMNLKGANGKNANVCTGWIKESEDSEIRLTSAYVTKKEVTSK